MTNLTVTSLGLSMAVGMAVFAFLGYWIDQKRGTTGTFTLMGMLMGVGYCFYEAWKFTRLNEKRDDAQNNQKHD